MAVCESEHWKLLKELSYRLLTTELLVKAVVGYWLIFHKSIEEEQLNSNVTNVWKHMVRTFEDSAQEQNIEVVVSVLKPRGGIFEKLSTGA